MDDDDDDDDADENFKEPTLDSGMEKKMYTLGFEQGVDIGKDQIAQESFDLAFAKQFHSSFKVGQFVGIVTAKEVLLDQQHTISSLKDQRDHITKLMKDSPFMENFILNESQLLLVNQTRADLDKKSISSSS